MNPHIKKINGMWHCEGYIGDTPQRAYEAWEFSAKFKHKWSGRWKGA